MKAVYYANDLNGNRVAIQPDTVARGIEFNGVIYDTEQSAKTAAETKEIQDRLEEHGKHAENSLFEIIREVVRYRTNSLNEEEYAEYIMTELFPDQGRSEDATAFINHLILADKAYREKFKIKD